MKTHYISPEDLTYDLITDIIDNKYKLEISDTSKALIEKCRNYLDEKVEKEDKPIYGITTGFGSLCNHSISEEDLSQLQKNLVMSHACGTGAEVRNDIVKIMMLLKAHALSFGHSGVQLITVQRILDFINEGITPIVYEQGSLGASGDLCPLANMFLPLLGLGEVYHKGEKFTGAEILEKFKWEPITLKSKEGLALLNGTQFMSAHAVYGLLQSFRLVKFADIIGALSLDAYDGRIDPFYSKLHEIRGHNGQIETANNFRNILDGSQMISREKKHVQDPYSFRCIPQVHGATKDTLRYVSDVVSKEMNAVTDNPTIFPDEDRIVSGGNFHGQPMALVLDFLSIAMAEIGSISERRVYRLIAGERGLPTFLVANPGLNSGFMIPQYAAASIVSQNKQLATPCSVDSIPSSNEQEDHVSMGGNAATKTIRVIENIERILAIELLNAAQAIDFRKPLETSPYLKAFLHQFREKVSFIEEDKVMYPEIDKSIEFLKQGRFGNY